MKHIVVVACIALATTVGCAGQGIAPGVWVGQLVADAVVDGARLPEWGALPGAPEP